MTATSAATTGEATARETAPGVSFRETMRGWFALDVADPHEGARRGREQGTRLTMRVTITIPDLDAFLADREHAGAIAGLVDFAPLGQAMRAERGDFRLFAPEDHASPGTKLMIYGLSFAHGDRTLHLAGRKLVIGDNPLRMWPETTTLYTTLHRDGIGLGPAIGAGILRLGPLDFVSILGTLDAPGATGASARAATLARFGRFFVGELWDSYVRGAAGHA